jgi:hypothetical protein
MALAAAELALVAVAAALLVRLHLLPTGISPVREAISDYGTTPFHRNYRAMVVALGVGAILLALALGRETDAGSLYWLWIFGASRVAIAGFMTDRDPPPFTGEGRIHWLLATVAFTSIAFAGSDIDWTGAPGALRPLGYAVVATAVATLVTRVAVPLRAVFGLAERALYVAFLAWLAIAAIDVISST